MLLASLVTTAVLCVLIVIWRGQASRRTLARMLAGWALVIALAGWWVQSQGSAAGGISEQLHSLGKMIGPAAASGAATAKGIFIRPVVSDCELTAPYVDADNGLSICFPAGWEIDAPKPGAIFTLEASRALSAFARVDFSTANIPAQIGNPTGPVVHGLGLIDGHRGAWTRFTTSVMMRGRPVRMTVVQYILPTADGRTLWLHIGCVPEQFDHLASVMRACAQALRILPRAQR